jgi:hypothetical protein
VALGNAQGAETVLKRLSDRHPSRTLQGNESPPAVPLPPLPALTTLRIRPSSDGPLAPLTHILSSIHSAPALTSITFTSGGAWHGEYFPSSGSWVEVDKWLAKMALQVRGSLAVTMAELLEDGLVWEEPFPKFREAGGVLMIETNVAEFETPYKITRYR